MGARHRDAHPYHGEDAMKVVHVVRQFYPSVGGMEEVVLNIARRHLAEGRDEVEVVTLDRLFHGNGERLPRSDDARRRAGCGGCPTPVRRAIRCARGCSSAMRGADVVHVHGIDFFYDYLALTAAVARQADDRFHSWRLLPYRLCLAAEADLVRQRHARLCARVPARRRHQPQRWRAVRRRGGRRTPARDRERCRRREVCWPWQPYAGQDADLLRALVGEQGHCAKRSTCCGICWPPTMPGG